MPRQPRLDTPAALHHIIDRGMVWVKIFPTDTDRNDFLNRIADLCRRGEWVIYTWALLPDHFHLLVRTRRQPLFASMKKLLTGYVVNFNGHQWLLCCR